METSRKRAKANTLLVACIAFLLAALLLGIGGTYAAFNQAVNHSGNEGYFDAKLVQTYEDKGDTAVYPGFSQNRSAVAKNNGTETMFVRMKLDKYWANKNTQARETDSSEYNVDFIEITLDDTSNWFEDSDGWYYYGDAIEPGGQTTSLLKNITISSEIGQERNTGESTAEKYNSIESKYLSEMAIVDVNLEAVTNYPEGYDPNAQGGSISPVSLDNAKSAFLSQTGDGLSDVAVLLFILCGVSFLTCILFFIFAKRRSQDEEENLEQALA